MNNQEKVFVYRNLHKNCFSVKSLKTKRVIAHVTQILLTNVEFKVSQAGRKRVLREKRKNVHAGVVGFWNKFNNDKKLSTKIYYNPYKYENFVIEENLQPVFKAEKCLLLLDGVYI